MDGTTIYQVEARNVAQGASEATARGKQTTVRFDSSADGSPSLFGPAELLASAFAACLLKNVERFSELLPLRYEGASVSVTAEREESPPRFSSIRYVLRLATDEEPERVKLLHRNLIGHGTVYKTLAATCDVQGEIGAERDVPAASEVP